METRSTRRKKPSHIAENGIDRISDFPDAVLHHILLLLPIKSIARTSLLSFQDSIQQHSFNPIYPFEIQIWLRPFNLMRIQFGHARLILPIFSRFNSTVLV